MITITKKDEEIHIVQDDFLLKQSKVMELFYFIILINNIQVILYKTTRF